MEHLLRKDTVAWSQPERSHMAANGKTMSKPFGVHALEAGHEAMGFPVVRKEYSN
jgi:hypothetical protein